jgi:hypothetical protein
VKDLYGRDCDGRMALLVDRRVCAGGEGFSRCPERDFGRPSEMEERKIGGHLECSI